MKCVCGYEAGETWDPEKMGWVKAAGNKEFTRIDTKATIEEGDYRRTQRDVRLYICPECGTVRAE